jgi:hypothetical protein
MGAYPFYAYGTGADAEEAFESAREAAPTRDQLHSAGGTVAEKDRFVRASERTDVPDKDPSEAAHDLNRDGLDRSDHPWVGKYGPAGAIKAETRDDGTERWLFFGWSNY